MRCPVCNYKSTRVVDSRLGSDGMSVRRRRECERQRCEFRFSTVEEMELLDVTMVKRNGKREAYSRDKLMAGLKRSLEKRPYTETELQTIVHNIERDVQKVRGGEITTLQVGDIVMKHLKTFDKVAYIRFASVYLSFEDVNMFEKELKSLKKTK
ncbi:MAG: transcriptional regulator NrdR [Patescibacteria group bacterium]